LSQENEDLKVKLETANSELKRINDAIDTSAMARNKEITEAKERSNQLAIENHRLQELATQMDASRAQQNDNNIATYERQIQELTRNLEEHKKIEELYLALQNENSALREQLKNQKEMAEAREKVVKDQQDESRRLAGQVQVLQEATKELKQLETAILTERKKNAESTKQLEISRQKVGKLEKAIEARKALERELSETNSKLGKELVDHKARERQATKVKEDLEAHKALERQLTEVNAQLGKDLEVLRLHAKKDSETCLALEQKVAQLTCELDKTKTEIQTLTESLNDALRETARAQTSLVNATNERDELKSKLFSLQKTAEELRLSLDDIKKGKFQAVQPRIPVRHPSLSTSDMNWDCVLMILVYSYPRNSSHPRYFRHYLPIRQQPSNLRQRSVHLLHQSNPRLSTVRCRGSTRRHRPSS
jgi:DNA repair exonuclease SbcCD ATPase subunit